MHRQNKVRPIGPERPQTGVLPLAQMGTTPPRQKKSYDSLILAVTLVDVG